MEFELPALSNLSNKKDSQDSFVSRRKLKLWELISSTSKNNVLRQEKGKIKGGTLLFVKRGSFKKIKNEKSGIWEEN